MAIDASILIYALDGGRAVEVDAAFAGRPPVLSPSAAEGRLRRGGTVLIENYLLDGRGRVGLRETGQEALQLQE
jgi:hypothetical protein